MKIIRWDAKKTGSKLGQPFRYGPTLKEYRKEMNINPHNWRKHKK